MTKRKDNDTNGTIGNQTAPQFPLRMLAAVALQDLGLEVAYVPAIRFCAEPERSARMLPPSFVATDPAQTDPDCFGSFCQIVAALGNEDLYQLSKEQLRQRRDAYEELMFSGRAPVELVNFLAAELNALSKNWYEALRKCASLLPKLKNPQVHSRALAHYLEAVDYLLKHLGSGFRRRVHRKIHKIVAQSQS